MLVVLVLVVSVLVLLLVLVSCDRGLILSQQQTTEQSVAHNSIDLPNTCGRG
jgi:hypothetical protein